MKDLYEIARQMEDAILNNPSDKIIESPFLTKIQAEKLSEDYLSRYHPRREPINPLLPEVSSYIVFVEGKKNA